MARVRRACKQNILTFVLLARLQGAVVQRPRDSFSFFKNICWENFLGYF